MGKYKPPPYKVKRDGVWITINPPEQNYNDKDKMKPIECSTIGGEHHKRKFKRKKK